MSIRTRLVAYPAIIITAVSGTLVIFGSSPVLAAVLASSVVVGAALFARSFTRPILELVEAAEQIGRGNLDVAIPVTRSDEIGALQGAVRDLAERRRQLLAAQARIAVLADLVDQARFEAVLVHDPDGTVRDCNRAAERIFRRGRERILGEPVGRLLRGPEGEPLDLATAGAAAEASVVLAEGVVVPVECSASVASDERGLVFVRDATERKEAEAALRASEARLQQAQKMEAIARLAGGVAHDFNNVLTVILGFSGEALREAEKGSFLEIGLNAIHRSAKRAASLTRQLLALGRRQLLQPCVLDLNEKIASVEGMLRQVVGGNVSLVCRLAPDLRPVEADPGQIEQVLMNLIINARDAMPASGGTITISSANVEAREGDFLPAEGAPLGWVVLEVADTGKGMDQATLSRIFEPFFTTKPPGEGTGLGLASVYGIVTQSRGEIAVRSKIGRGTVFRIAIPACEAAAPAPERPAPEPAEVRGSETVLLVEDEKEVRALLGGSLRRHGYGVVEATNGREALARFREAPAQIDVLVTDIVMPELGGKELVDAIVREGIDLPVVYISGYADRHVLPEDGTAPLLRKPFTPQLLLREVRKVLAR